MRTDVGPARAFAAMREAVAELQDVLEYPELREAVPLPTGAGYFLGASDDDYDVAYDLTVEVTRRRLEAAGVSGELYPFDTLAGRDPIRVTPPPGLLESHMYLPGQRVGSRWQAPEGAVAALVDLAVDWCQRGNPAADVHLTMSILFGVTANGGLARELLRLVVGHPHDMFKITAVADDGRFRHAVFAVRFGSVALAAGALHVATSGSSEAMTALRTVMVEAAPHVTAGFVKRSRNLLEVGTAGTLQNDWVPTPHVHTPRLAAAPKVADRFVPDAFGLQLLGPGHRDRLPAYGQWTVTDLDADRLLIEHKDLAAWYDAAQPAPDVLAEARADFAALLMRDDALEW